MRGHPFARALVLILLLVTGTKRLSERAGKKREKRRKPAKRAPGEFLAAKSFPAPFSPPSRSRGRPGRLRPCLLGPGGALLLSGRLAAPGAPAGRPGRVHVHLAAGDVHGPRALLRRLGPADAGPRLCRLLSSGRCRRHHRSRSRLLLPRLLRQRLHAAHALPGRRHRLPVRQYALLGRQRLLPHL